jgi:hypothetical protein
MRLVQVKTGDIILKAEKLRAVYWIPVFTGMTVYSENITLKVKTGDIWKKML